MADPADYLDELKVRLKNPSVSASDLLDYLTAALRDVDVAQYSTNDFTSQVIDTACQELFIDGKFPEVTGISASGVSTSLSTGDAERFRRRLAGRRQSSWMDGTGVE